MSAYPITHVLTKYQRPKSNASYHRKADILRCTYQNTRGAFLPESCFGFVSRADRTSDGHCGSGAPGCCQIADCHRCKHLVHPPDHTYPRMECRTVRASERSMDWKREHGEVASMAISAAAQHEFFVHTTWVRAFRLLELVAAKLDVLL